MDTLASDSTSPEAVERQRIVQALHDTVAQSLAAVYFHAKGIEIQLERDGSALAPKVAFLGELIQQASAELQEVMRAPDAG